jgi:hypothetical protein
MSSDIKYKTWERTDHALGPPGPTNCAKNTLLKNCRNAGRKCSGEPSCMDQKWIHFLQQLCKDISVEILVNNPTETWWKEVGSQKSLCCSACLDIQGGQFGEFV